MTSRAELCARIAVSAERLRAYLDGSYRYTAYRGRPPEGVPQLRRDLDIILGAVSNHRIAEAFTAAEKAFPGHYWMFGKGRTRPDEPLFGFAVFDKSDGDAPVAVGEHDDPVEAVKLAIAEIEPKGEA